MKKKLEISERFKALREATGKTQVEFADYIGVSQSAVSAWEVGDTPPSSEAWAKLGNLSSYPDNIECWKRAGMDAQEILFTAENDLKVRAAPPLPGETRRISHVRKTAQGFKDLGPEEVLLAGHVPNPLSTVCLVVDETTASLWIPSGSLIVLDTSQKDARDLSPLWGRMVLVDLDPRSPASHEYREVWARWSPGLIMGQLHYREYRHPVQTQSGDSVWVATVGRLGRYGRMHERLWEPHDEAVCVGLLVAHQAGLVDTGSFPSRPRPGEEHEAHHVKTRDQAPSTIRLDAHCKMLGSVIAFYPPAANVKE